MNRMSISCVIPSMLGDGEEFSLAVKLLGETRVVAAECFAWFPRGPKPAGPFNRCARDIRYLDNVLPEWKGRLLVDGGGDLEGAREIVFDGTSQGVFRGDARPIGRFGGFRWKKPGFHFIRLVEPESGIGVCSNPVCVSEKPPVRRIVWGDPHWQTFFSDGIRCPEELYSFARDEAFLDFGAISDHMEAISDRQWDYFKAVTNEYNEPGRFATLLGQEWTNHRYGHRNIYYRGGNGPALRSNDPDCDTLEKLWLKLDSAAGIEAVAVPHHTANKIMGADWSLGWNPKYEKAVEIYSCWGSSECRGEDGNPRPIRVSEGELGGRHVRDALNLGYEMGFVGGGDIHDGRPGDSLSEFQPDVPSYRDLYPQGLTAAFVPSLSRENVFDAVRNHDTYATTHRRIFLEVGKSVRAGKLHLDVKTASEDGIREATVIFNGSEAETLKPDGDPVCLVRKTFMDAPHGGDYCYVRVTTLSGDMAWSSPIFESEIKE